MIKKLKNKAGMSLMEVMVALLVMVLLVVGMGTGMDAGMRVYTDAQIASSSASLAGTINTALTDTLRYSQDIRERTAARKEVTTSSSDFMFTNLDYGLRDAYFQCDDGILKIHFFLTGENSSPDPKALVNSGSYFGLIMKSFVITYNVDDRGGYYEATYTLGVEGDTNNDKEVSTIVRLMNG